MPINTSTETMTRFSIVIESEDYSVDTLNFLTAIKTEEEAMEAAKATVRDFLADKDNADEYGEDMSWGEALINIGKDDWAAHGLFPDATRHFKDIIRDWGESVLGGHPITSNGKQI